MDENEFMSSADLAAYIGVAETTVAKWRQRRKGPRFCRLEGQVLYRRADVDQWVDDNCIDPRAEVG